MVHITPPREPLTDGVVTLRLPSMEAGDGEAAARHIHDAGYLDDLWLPMVPGASPGASVNDWLEGWADRPSRNGPVLVVTLPEAADFIGIVGFGEREDDCVEMIYGIAPPWRGRGFASRAASIGGRWALTLPGVAAVEVRINQGAEASQRVAQKAGFRPAGTVFQHVPGTGDTFEDQRFILDQRTSPDP
jgi:RimJ/RimL family protein N-acetyltransferase